MRLRLLAQFTVILWLALINTSLGGLLYAGECLTTSVMLSHKHIPFSKNELTLVSSNNTLKNLNKLFGESESDGQVYAEHLTVLFHGLLQTRLTRTLQENPHIGSIDKVSSTYIKTTEIQLSISDDAEFIKILKNLRTQIAGEISNYFLESKASARQNLLNEIPADAVFFEKNFRLLGIQDTDMQVLRERIHQKISNDLFRALLRKQLAVGVSPHRQLASIEARAMSKIEPYEVREDIGNISRILGYFTTAKTLKKSAYRWAFSHSDSDATKLAKFSLIRQNRSSNSSQRSEKYLKLLSQKPNSTPEEAHKELQSYVEYLSMIKELPSEVIQKTIKSSRDQFSKMQDPGLMVYVDVKGLGARNLVDVDKNITEIHQSIKDLNNYVLSKEDGDIDSDEIKHKYQGFLNLHQQVLANSVDFTTELHKELQALINRYTANHGIKPIVWIGGDDAFLLLPKSGIDSQTIGKLLKFDSSFGEDVRVAVGVVDPKIKQVDLEDIRVMFSDTVDALKAYESMDDHEHFAVVNQNLDKKTQVIRQSSEPPANVDTQDIQELRRFQNDTNLGAGLR